MSSLVRAAYAARQTLSVAVPMLAIASLGSAVAALGASPLPPVHLALFAVATTALVGWRISVRRRAVSELAIVLADLELTTLGIVVAAATALRVDGSLDEAPSGCVDGQRVGLLV